MKLSLFLIFLTVCLSDPEGKRRRNKNARSERQRSNEVIVKSDFNFGSRLNLTVTKLTDEKFNLLISKGLKHCP